MKYKAARMAMSRITPVLTHKVMYRNKMGQGCNLKTPKTFNEKISWLKLYELPNMPLATLVADKYSVRAWVAEQGYGNTLTNLIGSWNSAEDVPFECLPERFVIKCNHGCGMNIVCSNKSDFDVKNARQTLASWMRTNWALCSAEPHYGSIQRKVICEEYIEGPLSDYKFYCFGGEPLYYYVSQGLETGPTSGNITFFEEGGVGHRS